MFIELPNIMIVVINFVSYFFSWQNKDVTEAIQKVAAAYDCKIVEGVLSHQMKQFVIDGNKVVLSITNPETRVDEAEFEENEVYAIDIVTSTGEGKVWLILFNLYICQYVVARYGLSKISFQSLAA